MTELLTVLEALVAEVTAGRPAVFCVVLEKSGSAPRQPGAAMLVRSDGSTVGTVGGGAGEAVTQREARGLNAPRLLHLNLDDDHGQDDASICGGEVAVGLVPVGNAAQLAPFERALHAARRHQPAQVSILVDDGERRVEYRLHVETPPTLVIAGAGHVGRAVARLAADVDFRIVVIDDRATIATPAHFAEGVELHVGDIGALLRDYPLDPSCYVAIMTRGHRHDQAALEAVIQRSAAYVGMIASRRKAVAVLAALAARGVPADCISRVHTPIGLAIGAVTVNEIAVSIVAELVQERRKTTPKIVEGPFPVAPA